MPDQWFVNDESRDTGDFSPDLYWLTIGPHEGDSADSFAYSQHFVGSVPDDVEAKFRLMAAAPDLLAALKELLDAYEDGVRQCHCTNGDRPAPAPCTACLARGAIAKATGGN